MNKITTGRAATLTGSIQPKSPPPPYTSSPIGEAVEILTKEIGICFELVEELEARLRPILRAPEAEPGCKDDPHPMPDGLRFELQRRSTEIALIKHRIQSIIERLEV
ncbi:MAG: hypothetical protein ACOYD4_04125 [Solirubrobacterales bacterium]